MDREPDRAAGVGDAAGDRLADPPRGVGGELEALAPVELLHRVDQAEVALLDQVEQRQPDGLVLLGDGHHQAQVGLDERVGRLLGLADDAAQRPPPGGRRRCRPASSARACGAGLDGLAPGAPRRPWSAGRAARCRSGRGGRGLRLHGRDASSGGSATGSSCGWDRRRVRRTTPSAPSDSRGRVGTRRLRRRGREGGSMPTVAEVIVAHAGDEGTASGSRTTAGPTPSWRRRWPHAAPSSPASRATHPTSGCCSTTSPSSCSGSARPP